MEFHETVLAHAAEFSQPKVIDRPLLAPLAINASNRTELNMIITFAGHSSVSSSENIKESVKDQIRKNIADDEQIICYLGGYGDFDCICARACQELKRENGKIELVYVAPYISLSEQAKISEMQSLGLCDTSIYPPIENVPPKFAILKRNEWMIINADLVIVYINRSHGGAYRSLQTAKRNNKKIINVYEILR